MPIKKCLNFEGVYELKHSAKTGKTHALVPLQGGSTWKVEVSKLSLMLAAKELLEEEHPVTLRRLYYMLFSKRWIDISQETYSRIVIPVMTEARQRGIIPWHHLTDTTRPPQRVPMWGSPELFLQDAPDWYNRDIWEGQDVYIEVWVEKRADLAHVIAAAHPYGITVNAGNGYDGWSSIHDASLRLKPHEEVGRQCHVLYLGDFDPSGLHMAFSLEERLATFGVSPTFHRLGVNREDIDEHELPEWPGKESDPRADWMLERYGELIQVEMDALPVPIVQQKVREAVESLLNMEVFEATRELEGKEQKALGEALRMIRIDVSEQASPKKQKKEPSDDWKPGDASNW